MADLTEEDLAGMSPDQLRALQQQQCIFCHIISGKVPARKVYEDEKCVAILDINPGAPGHLLVLPKEHYVIVPQMPDENLSHIGMVVKHLSMAMIRALKVQGSSIIVANGPAAGQRAPHVIFHIIPRSEGDNLGLALPERNLSDEQLHALQDVLIPPVRKAFGLPESALQFPRPGKGHAQTASKDEEKRESNAKPDEFEKQEQAQTTPPVPRPPKSATPQPRNSPTPPSEAPATLDEIAKLLTGARK